jgi:hypothetical protein
MIKYEPYIVVEEEKIYKSEVKSMTLNQLKMFMSNIDDFKLLYKVSN